jgi:hypothetical protein
VKNDEISSNLPMKKTSHTTRQTETNNPLSIDQISTPLAFENIKSSFQLLKE